MSKYLISFHSWALAATGAALEAAGRESRAVIEEAKRAGVYVFAGGLDESVAPVTVAANGEVTDGGYPEGPVLNCGFAVFELPSREQAVVWASRLAQACRCRHELRVFMFDPAS